ncbi:MAG: polysaccharide deacetylase family protein, partial [Firmicutes bacterium]|nr:polysaccharide deacetylase family protein [Bacillota bacterium]
EQVFEMKEHGMEFGSHTCSHRHLDELPEEEMIREIVESKRCLEEKLQAKVTSFCYPSGHYNRQVKEAVRAAGYTAAVVTPRHGQINEDMYSLKRIGIYSNDTGWRFRLKIMPFFKSFRDLGLIYKIKRLSPASFP